MDARTTALTNATVFTGERVIEDCSLIVEKGRFGELVPHGPPPGGAEKVIDLKGRRIAPGFIDLQVNGGGGVLFNNSPTVGALSAMAAAHARFGTTAFLPTIISDDYAIMRAAIGAVRQARKEELSGVAGIHLEGPFLSPARRGTHDAARLRALDEEAIELLTSPRPDLVTLITLAPEKTTPERIARLCDTGAIVFGGHSTASYKQCLAAIDAGLGGFTHLFNGMEPIRGRDPGMVGAALDSPHCRFSIIADGHHVHPALLRLAVQAGKGGRALLVTDAMPTLGSKNTSFELYGETIELHQGVLRDASGSLAGANLGMIDAVRNVMRFADLDWTEAVRMASSYPARAIGVDKERGFIRPGYAADFVELGDDMALHRTWSGGEPVSDRPAMLE
ncbi:MAG: N-acetylglucosamine-6-phosphate deacetylase [Gammaproteobacteria bacterium]|nr:N-acetylglucosamine-6-phosphate deacetylase [Gammaproteobacteria bacterium]